MNVRLFIVSLLVLITPTMAYAEGKPSILRSLQMKSEQVGVVSLEFIKPKDKDLQNVSITIERNGYIQEIVNEINKIFILPVDIKIQFSDQYGPVYDRDTKIITMSDEFIFYLSGLYLQDYPKADSKEVIGFAEQSTVFFIYHELAHALIDVYSLPIVSNEETAADNLAVIIALEHTKDGYDIVMNTADLFDMLDRSNEKYDEDELWDEHALDSQRFYNIICLTYGWNPGRVVAELKKHDNKKLLKFIDEKGDFCKQEYQRQHYSWLELLDIHFTPSQ